jgi:hypothetical protein
MDLEEAKKSKAKVSRLAKKVNLGKLFETTPSQNSKAPWLVATVWMSLRGTPGEETAVC